MTKIRVCVRKRPLSKKELSRNEKDIATIRILQNCLREIQEKRKLGIFPKRKGTYSNRFTTSLRTVPEGFQPKKKQERTLVMFQKKVY
ncbi:hypothetical protein RhiirA1_409839 [Rhizophagus irregularis]|uniref:Kinesin motor domain-containing protein n=1 Tax=Rhizophagus irregularis TaxID=588596 RepID=A0A2N0SEN1_9GLOM|nr:hypothetical protein RhiirA1_409839 [Rhizophagus irregularis]